MDQQITLWNEDHSSYDGSQNSQAGKNKLHIFDGIYIRISFEYVDAVNAFRAVGSLSFSHIILVVGDS